MRSPSFIALIGVVALVFPCPAMRVPLSSQAVECGKPYAPCGKALPAGTNCPKGLGYCQPGYFCGTEANQLAPAKCLPVPKSCGTLGSPCCPSNAAKPHHTEKEKLGSKPYCKDGSTCFYIAPSPGWGDFHAGIQGTSPCQVVPQNCGTGPYTPCCPVPMHIEANPPLPRLGCPDNMFCDSIDTKPPQGSTKPQTACIPNPSDCGQFGKKCCVSGPGMYGPGFKCGPGYVGHTNGSQSGPRGYCANPAGFKGTGKAPLKDLICTQCPDKLDPSLEKTNPEMYNICRNS